MLPQQATTGSTPMEGIEKMNVVVVRGQRQGQSVGTPLKRDPYAMEVNRGRNCYACGGFRHIACHCRNRGRERPIEKRRIEYSRGQIREIVDNVNNLKRGENLELLD